MFDRVTGEPIWPIEERPVPKTEMPGEQSWPTQPYPTNPPPYRRSRSFGVDDISPYLPADKRDVQNAFSQRTTRGCSRRSVTQTPYTSRAATAAALFGGTAAEPDTGAVYVVAHENPGILRLLTPGETRRRGAPPLRRAAVYQQNCQPCHGADRLGTDGGAATRLRDRRSGEQHRGRRAALQRGRDPRGHRDRQRTDAAFPHLTPADVDNLVTFLTTRRRGRGAGGGRAWRRGAPADRAHRPS